MKKLVLLFIAVFVFSFASAQQFGVKAGFNSHITKAKTEVLGVNIDASTSFSGFYVGVFGEFELSDQFNLQPELLYAYTVNNGKNANLMYLPIMVKYYIVDSFSIQAGPQLKYLLVKSDDNYTNFSVGLAAGLGYDFADLGYDFMENFFADIRYSYGLTNQYTGSEDFSLKTSVFQVGVGYKF